MQSGARPSSFLRYTLLDQNVEARKWVQFQKKAKHVPDGAATSVSPLRAGPPLPSLTSWPSPLPTDRGAGAGRRPCGNWSVSTSCPQPI
jgi:hypothetical protein